MSYKPVAECTPEELDYRREQNRKRNNKYIANGGDRVKALMNKNNNIIENIAKSNKF